jgi:uncharacterized repeat protein (TIGR03803 family)
MPGKCISCDILSVRSVVVFALILLTAVVTLPAQGQNEKPGVYTLLHTFTNSPDGANPGAVIRDADGSLYGTTRGGGPPCFGPFTCGTIFKVDANGNETVLYTFQGGNDGAYPVAALTRDGGGNLFGNTEGNGELGALSTVFKLEPNGRETVIYDFENSLACCQDSPLTLDAAGNIYGTSPYAGESGCGYNGLGCGTVFKLTQAGKLEALHVFEGTDGSQPEGGVVRDAEGNIYGTALLGGNLKCYSHEGHTGEPEGCGTVFKLDHNGTFTILHTFEGHADGSAPLGLIEDPEGNLYGIAANGGNPNCNQGAGCGTIFKVDAEGKFSVLFTFPPKTVQPDFASRLLRDSKGNLYGVNQIGGAHFSGFIFKVDTKGKFTILFSFPSTSEEQDGSNPQGVTMDSAGDFYGSMLIRGSQDNNCGFDGCGTVFKVTF